MLQLAYVNPVLLLFWIHGHLNFPLQTVYTSLLGESDRRSCIISDLSVHIMCFSETEQVLFELNLVQSLLIISELDQLLLKWDFTKDLSLNNHIK